MLSSTNCQYFSPIHSQKAHVLPVFAMPFWYGMTVYVQYIQICYGVLHRCHYQLYTEKENRLYMHVLKSYAHIGSVLSSF